ncbi:MAG: amidohydrolase family protein [Halioglobus sp.]
MKMNFIAAFTSTTRLREYPLILSLGLSLGLLSACMSPEESSPIAVSIVDTGTKPLHIKNVTLFDSITLSSITGQDVVVENGKIASVCPAGTCAVSAQAHSIEGEGATLLPGLIDMHGHISTTTGPTWEMASPNVQDNLNAYVYAGVTTVFDPGDSSEEAFSRRAQTESGELIGPRIFTAGKIITDPAGHPRAMIDAFAPWWISWLVKPGVATGVSSTGEAVDAVNERLDAGADAIKLVVDSIPLDATIMPTDVLKALIDQTHARGSRAVAHIGTTADALVAAENGIDLWIHGVYKERIADDVIERIAAFDIPMVTTSEVFDRYGRALSGPVQPTRLESQMISQEKLASFYPPPEDFELGNLAGWVELMSNTREDRLENVSRLHAAGVTILAGSDTQSGVFPGTGLHREIATLVAAGLTPSQAIRAATYDSARYLSGDSEPDSGFIAPGKRADLLLVNGDPTVDISALSDIREVVLNGRLLQRKSLR